MGSLCMKASTTSDGLAAHTDPSRPPAGTRRAQSQSQTTSSQSPTVILRRTHVPVHEQLLKTAYGKETLQVGYNTDGHLAVSELDILEARRTGCSLLYGEVLPPGVTTLLSPQYLDAANATSLADLGMGTGKLALQAFLQFPNLREVIGIELSVARYTIAQEALLRLTTVYPSEFQIGLMRRSSEVALVTRRGPPRILRFVRGNILDVSNLSRPDVVVLETELPVRLHRRLAGLLSTMHSGARLLTYTSLSEIWYNLNTGDYPFRFHQRPSPKVLTSWSWRRGHTFFCWQMRSVTDALRLESCDGDTAVDEAVHDDDYDDDDEEYDDGVASTSSSAAYQPVTFQPSQATRLPSPTYDGGQAGHHHRSGKPASVGGASFTITSPVRSTTSAAPSSNGQNPHASNNNSSSSSSSNSHRTQTRKSHHAHVRVPAQVVVASPPTAADGPDDGPLFHIPPHRPRSASSRLQQPPPRVVQWKLRSRVRPGSADNPKRIEVRPRASKSSSRSSRPRPPPA